MTPEQLDQLEKIINDEAASAQPECWICIVLFVCICVFALMFFFGGINQ